MHKYLKTLFLTSVLMVTFTAGLTFADWSLTVWHGTDWISDGSVIDSEKVAENFNYLLGLNGVNCTSHNSGEVRFKGSIIEYCDGEVWGPADLYYWSAGAWGACTSAGQTRSVSCVDDTETAVSSSNCTGAVPPTTQSCTRPTFNGWSGSWQNGGLSSHFWSSAYSINIRSSRDSGTPTFNISTGYTSNGSDGTASFYAGAGNGGGTIYIYDQNNAVLYSRAISPWTWTSSYRASFTVPASTTSLRAYYQVSTIKSGHWNFADFVLSLQ
jgi:hypothetical protein